MKNIAIFASGAGSNAQKIIDHFNTSNEAKVVLLLSNNPQAYAIQRAKNAGIKTMIFDREKFSRSNEIIDVMHRHHVDYIVLAGFLWLVPSAIIKAFRGRIINIHPALLPAYGGKGMYGDHVHRAVIAAAEKESGITIHAVNDKYDSGDIIFQAKTDVAPDDTPETLAAKIHELEHRYFPEIIENEIRKL